LPTSYQHDDQDSFEEKDGDSGSEKGFFAGSPFHEQF
jgi:hypothetical protein